MVTLHLSTSVIIPTLNRPHELKRALESIKSQTLFPNQIIIVDQSKDKLSRDIFFDLSFDSFIDDIVYILDDSISGLVAAKNVGVNHASSDLILFLEDDIVLDSNYIYNCVNTFFVFPGIVGCCGIPINHPKKSWFYVFFFYLFRFGIFYDPRLRLSLHTCNTNCIVFSNILSGGISSWRRKVFDDVKFDLRSGFHLMEDMDFSTRVEKLYPKSLVINTAIKLAHYPSSINRNSLLNFTRRRFFETIVYYKKRKSEPFALLSTTSLLFILFLESFFVSIRQMSPKFLLAAFLGFLDGLHYVDPGFV